MGKKLVVDGINISADGRVCTYCHVFKPWEEFGVLRRSPTGRHPLCSVCMNDRRVAQQTPAQRENSRLYLVEWRKDPVKNQKLLDAKKRRRESDPDHATKMQTYNRALYLRNKEKIAAQGKLYYFANPDKIKAHRMNRRARQRAGGRLLGSDVRAVLAAEECFYCEAAFDEDVHPTLDHIIPLSKGGPNTRWNLVAACMSCNCRKHDRTHIQWDSPIGRKRVLEKLASALLRL